MSDAFRNALRAHIVNTTLGEPHTRPSLRQVIGTVLVMGAAVGLMVVLGMS